MYISPLRLTKTQKDAKTFKTLPRLKRLKRLSHPYPNASMPD